MEIFVNKDTLESSVYKNHIISLNPSDILQLNIKEDVFKKLTQEVSLEKYYEIVGKMIENRV